MKRFFFALLVAGLAVACNNSGDAAKDLKDSSDSIEQLKKESVNEAAKNANAAIEKEHDSLEKRIDSASKQFDTSKKAQ